MIKTHLSLNVRDVDASTAFYESFLGIPAHKRRPGYANFDAVEPPIKLALTQSSPGTAPGPLNHLGILVDTPEEVAAWKGRLSALGLVDNDEGDTVCCHARQDKFWVRDPDGNAWEVYALLDDMLDGAHEAPPTDTSCCVPAPRRAVGGLSLSMAKTSDNGGCCG
ncbi:MAG: ArsI/CadI family heavy metal resistance metalloenzyme [Armatimonadaceae bacterium]|jgi:catechol 2,3-dioxygenase-like lactoylglutathione lyase family enzyme